MSKILLPDPSTSSPQQEGMSFWEHVEDFRSLILRCSAIFILSCITVACFFPFFADLLNAPLKKALGDHPDLLQGLVTTTPMGIFSVLIQVCFLGGLALSLPIMLYLGARFVAPALSSKEKHILGPGCIAAFALFSGGALFSYYFVLPASLTVSIQLNKLFDFQLIWSAPGYYGLVVWMTLGIGLCFEFPLILLLLLKVGLLSSQKLKEVRRYMIVGILVVCAAIIPGGDPFSLIILAGPLYLSYEGVILLGERIERRRDETSY